MYQQVPEYYRDISERVSTILDKIGYSQKDRDRKIMCATASEVFNTMGMNMAHFYENIKFYKVGSRGESSTGPGLESDRDELYVDNTFKTVTDLPECQPGINNFLMVHDDYTHPGYVKLQYVDILPDNTPDPVFHRQGRLLRVDSYGRSVLSNQLIRALTEPASNFNGPALHYKNKSKELSCDTVFVIRCTQWPKEAHEWFQRRRPYAWPKSHDLQKGRHDSCFVAAVGHPHCREPNLDWRLSFSLTERRLIRAFEDTVMKVYVLLKMIRKTYIEPCLGDAFSSYHCKVCILWVREKTPPELWITENLLCCLTLCMKQLNKWVSMGYCPDYFIVTNNIYDRKLFGTAQFILTSVLRDLVSKDCQMLLGIKCCNLGQMLLHDCTSLEFIRNSRTIDINVKLEQIIDYELCVSAANLCRVGLLRDIPQEYNIMTNWIRRINDALQYAPDTLRICLQYVLMILFSQLGFHVVNVCKENAHSLSNEEGDYLIGLASRCLSLGINSDATSVRLKLCGLGTMLGYYDLTEICLQNMNDHMMGYKYSYTNHGTYTEICYRDMIPIEEYSFEELLHNQNSFSVVFLPPEISITPTPLRMEMFRSIGVPPAYGNGKKHYWHDWSVLDSRMCLYFFQYLNFFSLGKERHQQAAIDNMIHVVRTYSDILMTETELNVLGYCFMRETQLKNAFIWFSESLKNCPHHNAAKFYLGILFRKVYIVRQTRNIH